MITQSHIALARNALRRDLAELTYTLRVIKLDLASLYVEENFGPSSVTFKVMLHERERVQDKRKRVAAALRELKSAF
jgi:hypothetical protein